MQWDTFEKKYWKDAKPPKNGHNGNTEIIQKGASTDTELNPNGTRK